MTDQDSPYQVLRSIFKLYGVNKVRRNLLPVRRIDALCDVVLRGGGRYFSSIRVSLGIPSPPFLSAEKNNRYWGAYEFEQ